MTNDELEGVMYRMLERVRRLPKPDRDAVRYHEERAELGSDLCQLGQGLNPRPRAMSSDELLRRARSYVANGHV